jgi:hypothetical protein
MGVAPVAVVAVRPVKRWPAVVAVHGNNRIVLAKVDVVELPGTRVPVPLVVGVVPARIRVIGIVPGIHGCVECADSDSGIAGSETHGNREVAPGILPGRGVRMPGDRKSDQ